MKKSRLSKYLRRRFTQASSRALPLKRQAPPVPQISEFEVLENRLLLSGVISGIDQTRVQYTDADGDLVTVAVRGVGATFDIELAGGLENGADAVSITLKGAGASLGISVAAQGFETDDITPGFTTVGLITTKETSIGSINLNAVIAPVIDLGNADVAGIKLTMGQVAKVDALMGMNEVSMPGFDWVPGLNGLDLFDVTAGSVDQINLAGSLYGGNDFVGTIKITEGGLENLTGPNSGFYGHLVFEGEASSLGHVVLGNGWSSSAAISAAGDLTLQAEDFAALVTVGGHLNVSFTNGFFGTIFADGGVSGLRADTTDDITVSDGSFRGQLISGGEVADIMFSNSRLDGGVIEATNIGTVRFDGNSGWQAGTILSSGDIGGVVIRGGLDVGAGSLLLSAEGKLGHISVADGNLNGSVAAGSIGDIWINGGDLNATVVAKTGDIGNVTVDFGEIRGTIYAKSGNIGDITVLSDTYGAAISDKIIASSGSIGTINVTNLGWGEAVGGDAVIFAKTNITAINASTTGDTAIGNATITAQGTLGPVNAIAYGAGGNGAIDGLTLVAPTIGAITATSISGTAIANSTFIATTGAVGSITGTGKTYGLYNVTVTAATSIGNISGQTTTNGDGIDNSRFSALGGSIGTVTGTSAGVNSFYYGISNTTISATGDIGKVTGTAFGGTGIYNTDMTSLKGNIGDVVGSSLLVGGNGEGINESFIQAIAGSIGNVTGTAAGNGNGIDDTTIEALTGIGTLTGSSITNDGIDGTNVLVSVPGANIAAIVASTVSGIAINDSNFTAIGGTIGSISATPTGVGGRAIDGSDFTAATLGDLTVTITNLAGGYAVNNSDFVATQGNIGKINVTNNSLANGAFGIQDSEFRSNKGNIGDVTVSTTGNDSDAIRASYGYVTEFIAAGNIGKVTLTTSGNYSDGIDGRVHFFADNTSKAGDIGDVSVTVSGAGSIGIVGNMGNFPRFESQNIGNVSVNVTNLGGYRGIVVFNAQQTVFDIVANMGTFTVTNAGTAPFANGLDNVKVDVGGTLGAVSITTVGGAGMVNSSIDPTTIASVTITSDDGDATNGSEIAMDNASEIIATVSIGNVTITGDVNGLIQTTSGGDNTATTIGNVSITGDFAGNIVAGTTIGTVNITGDAVGGGKYGIIAAGTEAAGNIGNVTVGTANGLALLAGTYSATPADNFAGTVGNIVISGNDDADDAQNLTVQAVPATDLKSGGTVGTISAKGITDDGEFLAVNVIGLTQTLGALTVENADANETAGLLLSLGAKVATLSTITVDGNAAFFNGGALATIGVVSIGGDATLLNAFNTVKTASTFGANKVLGGQTFGTGEAGSTIGKITINDGSAAANNATFTFATMNGKTNATASVTLAVEFLTGDGPHITTTAAKAPGTTVAGITAILV